MTALSFRLTHARVGLLFGGVLFLTILNIIYVYGIAPVFGGFIMNEAPTAMLLGYIVTIAFLYVLPVNTQIPSTFFLNFIFLLTLLPLISLYQNGHLNGAILLWSMIGFAIIAVICRKVRFKKIEKRKLSMGLLIVLILPICIAIFFHSFRALDNFNLNFYRVYDYRASSGRLLNYGLWGYINTISYKVLFPFLLAFCLVTRRYFSSILLLSAGIFLFAVTSHKAILFFFLAPFFFCLVNHKNLLRWLYFIVIGVSVVSSLLYFLFNSLDFLSLFVRRIFFLPAKLIGAYYDFFSQEGFMYWSHSVASRFLDSPYEISPALIIGQYIGQPGAWANVGFFGSGYMNAGVVGIIFYSITIGFILSLIDTAAKYHVTQSSRKIIFSVLFAPLFSLFLSADLPTTLLTHGLIASLVIIFLLPQNISLILKRRGAMDEMNTTKNVPVS